MKALVKYAPGHGHVAMRDVPVREPGPDELLIRVKYCGICGTDLHIYADEFPNDPPVVMGHEYCGTVVQVGAGVRDEWSVGDRVVGELHTGACGTCALCLAGKPHICDRKAGPRLALQRRVCRVPGPARLAGAPRARGRVLGGGRRHRALCHRRRTAWSSGARSSGVESVLITGSATMGLMSTIWASRLGADRSSSRAPTWTCRALSAGAGRSAPRAWSTCSARTWPRSSHELHRRAGRRRLDRVLSGSGAAIAGGLDLVKKTGKVVLIGLVGPETIPVPWNTLLYKELDLVGLL